MLKKIQQNIILWVQAKTGLSVSFVVCLAIAAGAAPMVSIFLCAAAYAGLSDQIGPVFGALAMAGIFLLIAAIAAGVSVILRRRTQQRAILARVARSPEGRRALTDPKVLNIALRAGRSVGWERATALALLGFLAAQWVREARSNQTGARI